MKKATALILTLVMLLSLLAGCGTGTTAETQAPAAQEQQAATPAVTEAAAQAAVAGIGEKGVDLNGRKAGFSVPTLDSEFFVNMSGEIEAYLADYGMSLTTLSADTNAATQIENVENFTTMGMDVIILFLVDNKALEDTLVKARENGAYVIVIGTILENKDAVDCCINVDQTETGEVAAQMMADWVEETFPDAEDGSIIIALLSCRTNDTGIDRSAGMLTVTDRSSKINLVEYELENENDAVLAQQYTEQLFIEHPDCKGILCYGSDFAIGANEIAMKKAEDLSQFSIITTDVPEAILSGITASVNNESLIRGTVALGAGTPYTIYQLVSGAWSDQIGEDAWFREPCYDVYAGNIDNYID